MWVDLLYPLTHCDWLRPCTSLAARQPGPPMACSNSSNGILFVDLQARHCENSSGRTPGLVSESGNVGSCKGRAMLLHPSCRPPFISTRPGCALSLRSFPISPDRRRIAHESREQSRCASRSTRSNTHGHWPLVIEHKACRWNTLQHAAWLLDV
jgi:hypothetical protein